MKILVDCSGSMNGDSIRAARSALQRIRAAPVLPMSAFDGDDVTVFARLHADNFESLTGSVQLIGQVDGVEGDVCIAGFEVPSFLRVRDDAHEQQAAHVWIAPPLTTPFWVSNSGGVAQETEAGGPDWGLSPAGLAQALNATPRSVWPKTFKGLEEIQLLPRVIEWLEVDIGRLQPEAEVIQAFLEVMMRMEFDSPQEGTVEVNQMIYARGAHVCASQTELREQILRALAGITDAYWPSTVLDYAEAGQGDWRR